jgi:hypothetical protein
LKSARASRHAGKVRSSSLLVPTIFSFEIG